MTDLKKVVAAAEKFVRENSEQFDHLVRTAFWVKKLTSRPSEALIIAALMHDIERAFLEGRRPPKGELTVSWCDMEYLRWHEDRSAQIVSDFLKRQKANPRFIKHVVELVKVHEEGGWEEAKILKDADSISFLEIVVPFFISQIPKLFTKRQVKEKADYMYNRIISTEAKQLAQPFYEKALKTLEGV